MKRVKKKKEKEKDLFSAKQAMWIGSRLMMPSCAFFCIIQGQLFILVISLLLLLQEGWGSKSFLI